MKVNGKRIKQLREAKDITRVELALAADLGEKRISQIEDIPLLNMNKNVARAIARRLGVKLEEISE